MSDQPKEYPRAYGFAPKRRHFVWRNPEEVQPPVPGPERGQISLAEALDAVRELGTTAPSVAKEVLRILTDEKQQPQQSEPSTALVLASNTKPADEVNDATSIVVLSETESSRRASPTTDVATAPATIEVTSPPAKSRGSRGANSRAKRGANSRARKKSRKKRTKAPAPPPEFLSRRELHEAHCGICGDELQEEIDEAFISWESVNQIAFDYKIDRRAIYRHAHATGLFAKRDRNIRRALGRIIHEADRITVTSDSVIRAAKMLTHINTRGAWVNPPTHVIFSAATAHPATVSLPKLPKLSDTPCKVKKSLKP